MSVFYGIDFTVALLPAVLMAAAALGAWWTGRAPWRAFIALALVALVLSLVALGLQLGLAASADDVNPDLWLAPNLFGAWVSALVQLLGAAIGVYSSKHLQGEPRQSAYVVGLAAVLASVHVLLLANHWVVLIAAWAAIQYAMHGLLCFYPERPFAVLAAHKKRVTDRAVDILLVIAAALGWWACGSGSLTVLWQSIAAGASSPALQWSGVCLALAVIARTALMPVHGWLVQVMEAPTPVSALLHAGVVNLGGYVLVLFAPLLGVAPAARWLLVVFGLVSAVVAGLVLLTRVTQKVHLAWSTIAQMGFMLLECGLGLYLLAALHLLGHSLYKAHNFLAASGAVKDCKRKLLTGEVENSSLSMALAVPVAVVIVAGIQFLAGNHAWPWWWSGVLALAWAPLLWVPGAGQARAGVVRARLLVAAGMAVALTVAACIVDRVPVGAGQAPLDAAGVVALVGMASMYFGMVALQLWPRSTFMVGLRRWVYAGFYMDEIYTRWVLRFWPVAWAQSDEPTRLPSITPAAAAQTPNS
ncbi:MAG: NADH-quinone oxidoreductase subunit L [Nevskiaceae bacterium]|nr:MAG: NADH-quinone oxidoreductase subunit L [Nevskiaceae bacterium]TBR74741.1 MAG: NADH-quinone oxidoreductase subunit L [Nevskiaceae bacterium]